MGHLFRHGRKDLPGELLSEAKALVRLALCGQAGPPQNLKAWRNDLMLQGTGRGAQEAAGV